LELAKVAGKAGDVGKLKAKVDAEPGNHQARIDYAIALAAAGQKTEASEQLLESFRRDRKWNDEAARKQLVKFFEILGPTHPQTVSGRKRLSSLMFA
jgi:putative thioredoxin